MVDGSITCPECGRVHLGWQWSLTPERDLTHKAGAATAISPDG